MAENILIVDDEPNFLKLLASTLDEEGYAVKTNTDPSLALSMIEKEVFDLIITDLAMPELGGLDLMKKINSLYPGLPVIIITGVGTIELAVEAMKKGAYDFITKPFELDRIIHTVKKAIEHSALCKELFYLRKEVRSRYQFNIIGQSKIMKQIFSLLEKVADTSATILIQGESGTGKEVLAKAIHYQSARRDSPFLPIDCGALSTPLLESELFGHVKGAFTGAHKSRAGLFEAAKGGTIFLDEIQDIPPETQSKLLRVLQEKEVKPVGSDTFHKILDIRLIAATQQDLIKLLENGRFREDLYYRLKVFEVKLPPLRERKNDIPLLIDYFIKLHNKNLGKQIKGVEVDALDILCSYNYPGNVRELEHIIERATILCKGNFIGIDDIPKELYDKNTMVESLVNGDKFPTIPKNNEELKAAKANARKIAEEKIEQLFINSLLPRTKGNISEAARQANMNRSWLAQLVKKYNLDLNQFRKPIE